MTDIVEYLFDARYVAMDDGTGDYDLAAEAATEIEALRARNAELEAERKLLRKFAAWFSRYPEFIPNSEMLDAVVADRDAAFPAAISQPSAPAGVSDPLAAKVKAAVDRYSALSPEEKAAHDAAQRESFLRGMGPCEHGNRDWETRIR